MRKLILFLFLVQGLFLAQKSYGQRSIVDSLKNAVDTCSSDLKKVRYLNELASSYWYIDADSALIFAEQVLEIVESNKGEDWIKERANAFNNKGVANYIKGNYPKSLYFFQECKSIAIELNDSTRLASSFNNLGLIQNRIGNYTEALEAYRFASTYFLKQGEISQALIAKQNIANVYFKEEKYHEALGIYKEVYHGLDSLGVESKALEAKYNIGLCLTNLGQNKEAEVTLLSSVERAKTTGNNFLEAMHYVTLGAIKMRLNQFNQAHIFLLKAEEMLVAAKVSYRLHEVYENLSIVKEEIGDMKSALKYSRLYSEMKDSLIRTEKIDELTTIRLQYDFGQERLKDSLINAQRQKEDEFEIKAQAKVIANNRQVQYLLFGGLAIVIVFSIFLYNRFKVTRKQKVIIESQKEKVDIAYDELEEKNQEIMDSITYAKRIQSAILPPRKIVKEYLNQSFILYKPKDIVAGDFYWMETLSAEEKLATLHSAPGTILLAVADCTGHGVPGAMVSVICNNGLNRSVREHGLTDPAEILDKTREIVIKEFEKSEEEVKDGMDIALVSLNFGHFDRLNVQKNEVAEPVEVSGNSSPTTYLKYAGAHNPLWIIRKDANTIEEIKGDKQPIGKFRDANPFTSHQVDLFPGDTIYIFSDGYADQFGGEKGKKLKTGNFKKLVLSMQSENMDQQKIKLDEFFEKWRGPNEQLDDVCVIGVRV